MTPRVKCRVLLNFKEMNANNEFVKRTRARNDIDTN